MPSISPCLIIVEISVERPISLPRQLLFLFPAVPQVRLMRGLMALLSGYASPTRLSACREIAIAQGGPHPLLLAYS